MKSVPVVAFDYRTSRTLIGALMVGAALAVVAAFQSGLPMLAKVTCACLAIGYIAYSIRRLRRAAPTRVAWQSAGHWRLCSGDGVEHNAELRNAVVRGEWLVLNLTRSDGRPVNLILLPDNSSPDVRRQLRVRLSRGLTPTRA